MKNIVSFEIEFYVNLLTFFFKQFEINTIQLQVCLVKMKKVIYLCYTNEYNTTYTFTYCIMIYPSLFPNITSYRLSKHTKQTNHGFKI